MLFTYKSQTLYEASIHLPIYKFPSLNQTVCYLRITPATIIIINFTDPYMTRVIWLKVGSVILIQKMSNKI